MVFQLPKEVLDNPDDDVFGISKRKLLLTCIEAVQTAWDGAIRPRVEKIRSEQVAPSQLKKGFDFFTEADTESERIIKEVLVREFGSETFRVFGEELGQGVTNSPISIRIDPIDGTELFKFGAPSWAIMMGAYTGKDVEEKQFMSVTYFPEYFGEIIFRLDDIGVYKLDVSSERVSKFQEAEPRDEISDLLLLVHKNHAVSARGVIEKIITSLEELGARVRSTSPAYTKQALETRGGRAFIIQGDFNKYDFVLYSALVSLGYKVYAFDGTERNIDDPGLEDSRFILVPPGRAGILLRDIVSKTENI